MKQKDINDYKKNLCSDMFLLIKGFRDVLNTEDNSCNWQALIVETDKYLDILKNRESI